MRILTIDEIRNFINNEDNALIGCYVTDEDFAQFYNCGNGEFESGDWFEGEGARELIVDENKKILRFEGYYCDIY